VLLFVLLVEVFSSFICPPVSQSVPVEPMPVLKLQLVILREQSVLNALLTVLHVRIVPIVYLASLHNTSIVGLAILSALPQHSRIHPIAQTVQQHAAHAHRLLTASLALQTIRSKTQPVFLPARRVYLTIKSAILVG
jgi:hypothetical protein